MTVDATLAKLSTIDKTFATALIAAVGYLCNLAITSIRKQRDQRLERRAGLMRLHSVLTTMKAAYNIQSGHRNNLVSSLRLRFPKQVLQPYEDFLSASYKSMDPSERELHAIIRGITIHALKPLNTEAQRWLANDTFYRSRRNTSAHQELSDALNQLDSHLWLWLAKYESWIPADESHSLVYLGDEKEHGVPFPVGIEKKIRSETGARIR